MIKELRKLDKIDRAKSNYIRFLQNSGRISKLISENGYLCYDTIELAEYYKTARVGRPVTIKTNKSEE